MKKILLVDDAKVFLEVERTLFLRTGAQIYTATTGAEALRLAFSERPDIILLDLVLPDITGDKVCMQIKGNPATSGIPIIMVTTISKEEEMERCRRAGCEDYVTKPINYSEMLGKVAQMLRIPHRVPRRVLVRMEINADKGPQVLYGSSVDLSVTGMLIECAHVLRVGDSMAVRFFLPGRNEIMARGRIVRSQSAELRKFRYGFQFDELADADREAISLLVRVQSHPQ
jgi:CheY-like chemotaxis protein